MIHEDLLTVRVGRYVSSPKNTVLYPPSYYLEFESHSKNVLNLIKNALKEMRESYDERINGNNEEDVSFAIEYRRPPNRLGLNNLEDFIENVMNLLVTNHVLEETGASHLINEIKEQTMPAMQRIMRH